MHGLEYNTPSPPLLDRTLIVGSLALHRGRFSTGVNYELPAGADENASVDVTLDGSVTGARAVGTLTVNAIIVTDAGQTTASCTGARPIRWSASARDRSVALTAPVTRPDAPPPGFVVYARRRTKSAASAIWASDSDARAQVQLTHPPAGASDAEPAIAPYGAGYVLVFQRSTSGIGQIYESFVPLRVKPVMGLRPATRTVQATNR